MHYIIILFLVSFLVTPTSSWAQGAFQNCESAFNHGSNNARTFVSAVFNRVTCEASQSEIESIQSALAQVFQNTPLPTSDSLDNQSCWFRGLHEGAMLQLGIEYEQCDLGCVELGNIGLLSASLFVGLHATVETQDRVLTSDMIEAIFAFNSDNTCSFDNLTQVTSCKQTVAALVTERLGGEGDQLSDALSQLVMILEETVCAE